MNAFLRLLRYAVPYRGRLAWAVLAMLVYAIASACLAYLIKPIFDSVLPNQQSLALTAWAIVGFYVLKGAGSYVSSSPIPSEPPRRRCRWSSPRASGWPASSGSDPRSRTSSCA